MPSSTVKIVDCTVSLRYNVPAPQTESTILTERSNLAPTPMHRCGGELGGQVVIEGIVHQPKLRKMDFFDEQLESDASLAASSSRAIRKKEESEGEGILTVDVYQTDDEIIVKSTIAGVSGDDIDIAVTKDTVTIKGSRKTEEKIREPNYYYRELYWGAFSRSIILPEDVDPDGAKASMKNGLLTIRLPKLVKTRTKKIKILS